MSGEWIVAILVCMALGVSSGILGYLFGVVAADKREAKRSRNREQLARERQLKVQDISDFRWIMGEPAQAGMVVKVNPRTGRIVRAQ